MKDMKSSTTILIGGIFIGVLFLIVGIGLNSFFIFILGFICFFMTGGCSCFQAMNERKKQTLSSRLPHQTPSQYVPTQQTPQYQPQPLQQPTPPVTQPVTQVLQIQYCSFCGKKIQPGWQVCGYCGKKIIGA